MNVKRPLAFLMVAVMAVAMFGAMPVAAQDTNQGGNCTAQASNAAYQTNVGAYQTNFANQNANAIIDNDQRSWQTNVQSNKQVGVSKYGNVNQVASNTASNTNYQSQCEANQG